MLVNTHIAMAKIVKPLIESSLSVKLDTKGYLYGNIKPDLKPDSYFDVHSGRKKRIDHFKHCALPHVLQRLESLMERTIFPHSKCSQDFSIELGALTHYFCDFFCHVHTVRFTGNLSSHFLYEFKLAAYMNRFLVFHRPKISFVHNNLCLNSQELLKRFESCQLSYFQQKPSMALDATWALRFSAVLGISVLSAAMENGSKIAA